MSQTWASIVPTDNVDITKITDRFASLLSNFSGASAPSTVAEGQLWHKTGDDTLKISLDGATFSEIAAAFAANSVLASKLAASATAKLFGRYSSGAGAGEEVSLDSDMALSAGALRVAAFTGDVTKSAGGTALTIANDAVTYAKMQNVVANQRVLGRTSGAGGDVEEVSASGVLDWLGSTRGQLLYRGSGGWSALSPSTAGYVLKDGGAGADPSWAQLAIAAFADNVITAQKLAASAANILFGRKTASAGAGEEITLAADHAISAGALQLGAFTGDITKTAGSLATSIGSNKVLDAMLRTSAGLSVIGRGGSTTGNVADITGTASQFLGVNSGGTALAFQTMSGDATLSGGALTIASNAITTAKITDANVTYAKIQNVAALSVFGRSANTSGVGADITGTDGQVLRVSGTTLGFGTIVAAGIASDAVTTAKILNANVTLAKMANIATATFIGRTTAGTGVPEALTVTQATALLNAMVGDSGSGGTKGLVPAPASGDAAAAKFLKADGTWAVPAGSGGVSDGDKGDITVSSSGTVWTIDNSTITLAKMANLSGPNVLMGRKTAGAGAPEEITLDTDHALSSGALRLAAFTGDVTKSAGGTALTLATTAITGQSADTSPDATADYLLEYDNSATAYKKVLQKYIGIGRQGFFVPAAAMLSNTTNGPASGTVETTTNKVMFSTLDFDASTAESAQFDLKFPKSFGTTTVTFIPVWSHASTATNFGVVWELAGLALSDNDAGDTAFGTGQTSSDAGGTTNNIYHGPESSAITIGNTLAAEDWVKFRVKRLPADANDTMAIDARLHGVMVFVTTTQNMDG